MSLLNNKLKNKLIILMTAMFFVGVSATDIYIPSLPQMVIDFHSSPEMVNLTLAIYSIGIAFAVLASGELSNRFGRRLVLLSGLGIFSLSALLMALTGNLGMMIGLRGFQAAGASILLIVPRLVLKDCMDEQEQIRANGILLMSLIVSPAVSPIIGAHLAYWFGWRSCFIVTFLASVALFIWAGRILPETNHKPLRRFKAVGYYFQSFRFLISNRVFVTVTLVYASGIGAYFSFIGISSYLYIKAWKISPINYSYIFLGLSLAYLIGNQIMQKLNKHKVLPVNIIAIGVYSTLIGEIIILAAALFLQRHITGLIFLVSFGVLFMRAANALINPPTQIMVMNQFYEYSAQALGLNLFVGFTFSGLATYLVTLMPGYPFLSFIVISSVYILLCVAIFLKNRRFW